MKLKVTRLDSFLTHYGIKGMKWGVRRKKPSVSSDYASVAGLRGKKARTLSNKEIKKLTTRLRLERDLQQLSPPKNKRIKALLGKFMKKYSESFVDKAAASAANKSYDTMIKELAKARKVSNS